MDRRLEKVLEEAAERVNPKPLEYRVAMLYYRLLEKLLHGSGAVKRYGGAVSLQGSVAKDTWVSGDFDLDVFVSFPRSLGREWILGESLAVILDAVRILPHVVDYAQHPYVTVVYMGLEANVVPVLEAGKPGDTRLAVERTPFHTRYVSSRLPQSLKSDVRLLKSFLKGVGVYGAEVKVGGFSGYLAELMVIHYGGFLEALSEISRWKPPIIVDMEHGLDAGMLRERFKDAPLVWVDPVDPDRNVAAAVRLESLARLVMAARFFLRRPGHVFFHYASKPDKPVMPPRDRGAVLVYRVDISTLTEQTLWGEIRRIMNRVRGFLSSRGYRVVYTGASTDMSGLVVIAVEVEAEKPGVYVEKGPPVWVKGALDYVDKRLLSGEPVWIGWDGRLYSERTRRQVFTMLLEEGWREYTVAPHFREYRPRVYPVGGEPEWLRDKVLEAWRRLPAWLR